MTTTRNLIATVIVLAITSTSFAQFVDFSGQTADDPTWTVNAFDGIMTASFSSSFSNDAVRWTPQTKSFTDPAFVQMFGVESGSLITLIAQDNQPTASTTVTLMFSSPLPIDARLVVFDLDGASERMALSSNDGSIVMPTEMESNDPNTSPQGASDFALWSQNQQRLLSTDMKQNDREAYMFDIGGMTHLDLVMSAGEAAANWIGIAPVVPEPGSSAMVLIGFVALGLCRRRS